MSSGIINLKVGEHDLQCWYDYSPGRPGKMYLANGDPGYPDEPAEFALTSIMLVLPEAAGKIELLDLLEELGALETLTEKAEAAFDEAFEEEEAPFEQDLEPLEAWERDWPTGEGDAT